MTENMRPPVAASTHDAISRTATLASALSLKTGFATVDFGGISGPPNVDFGGITGPPAAPEAGKTKACRKLGGYHLSFRVRGSGLRLRVRVRGLEALGVGFRVDVLEVCGAG